MAKARVAWIAHDAGLAGAPRSLNSLLLHRERRFHHILIPKRRGELFEDLAASSDEVVAPGGMFQRLTDRPRARFGVAGATGMPAPPRRIARWLLARGEEAVAARLLAQVRPDVVFANTVACADYVVAARARGIPAIFYCQEVEPRLSEILHRYRLHASDSMILAACSPAARRAFATAMRVEESSIEVIPVPVDAPRIDALSKEAKPGNLPHGASVVAMGTLVPGKRPDLFLEVAKQVISRADAHFVWIGDGPLLAPLRHDAARADLSRHVHFVGSLVNPYPVLKDARAFVSTSGAESFGLAAAEAMVLQRPVVAFQTEGLAELIADDGIIIPQGSVRKMADALVDILESSAAATRQMLHARARMIDLFSPEAAAAKATGLIGRALAGQVAR